MIQLKMKKIFFFSVLLIKLNINSQKEVKSIPLIHIYMAAHFPGLVEAIQQRVDGLS